MDPVRYDQKTGRRLLLAAAAVLLALVLLLAAGKRFDSGRSDPEVLTEDHTETGADVTKESNAAQERPLEGTGPAQTPEEEEEDEDADPGALEERDSAGRQILPSQKLEPTGVISAEDPDTPEETEKGEPASETGPDAETGETEEPGEEDGVALPVILFD